MSGDKTLKQEIIDKVDIHENNRDKFKLGGQSFREGESRAEFEARKQGRLIAKIFKFRLIYGGSAYSYANDSDFQGVSKNQKFWQSVIEEYYSKYTGIKEWHEQLIATAQREGVLKIPSGRQFPIAPMVNKWNGGLDWPITVIKNYPVQGFGADLVMLARLEANKGLSLADWSTGSLVRYMIVLLLTVPLSVLMLLVGYCLIQLSMCLPSANKCLAMIFPFL